MRGNTVPIGTETVASNGYVNVKTENGWKSKHHLVAEEMLGRPLLPTERVKILPGGDKQHPTSEYIEVVESKAKRNQIHRLQMRVENLTRELEDIKQKLDELAEL